MLRFVGLLLGSLLVLPASAQGQEAFQYGFTLGFNRATMESPADLGAYTSFSGGVILRRRLRGPASLQSGLLLSQKGAEVDGEEGGPIEYGTGYLELPLLIHLSAPPVKSVVLHGEAGGFGAVKLFERQTPGEGDLNVSFDTGTSFFQRFDAGVAAGVGVTLPFQEQRLNLTLRREWGLVDVARDVGEQPFPDAAFPASGETRTWTLLLRLGF